MQVVVFQISALEWSSCPDPPCPVSLPDLLIDLCSFYFLFFFFFV